MTLINKKIYKSNITKKGKYIVKVEDQALLKLLWKLKDKSSKHNYDYNNQLRDAQM